MAFLSNKIREFAHLAMIFVPVQKRGLGFSPKVQARDFKDAFGNICSRLVAPTGLFEIRIQQVPMLLMLSARGCGELRKP